MWIGGGGAGAILYLIDWGEVDYFVMFGILSGAAISAAVWKLFPMGDADALGILAVSVVYPVSFGTILVPAAVFFGGIILEHLAAFFLNLRYNIEDLFKGDCFSGVQCTRLSKVARARQASRHLTQSPTMRCGTEHT